MKKTNAISIWILILFLTICFSVKASVQNNTPHTLVTPTDVSQPTRVQSIAQILEPLNNNRDIWIPLLPEEYKIKSITTIPNGSYYYTINSPTDEDMNITQISLIKNSVDDDGDYVPSFYTHLLKEQAFSINPQTVELMSNHQKFTINTSTHSYTVQATQAKYGTLLNRPALFLSYASYFKPLNVGGHYTYNPFGETVIQLSSNQLLSVCHGLSLEGLPFTLTTFGDADLNGFVDAKDALQILKHIVGKKAIDNQDAFFLCDFDQSQSLTAKDALAILRKAVGLPYVNPTS